MKQTIQLRLGQHLTMTPQLQQAIRLLQLSTLDLKVEIQDALESNLMLETEEEGRHREQPNGLGENHSEQNGDTPQREAKETPREEKEVNPEQSSLSEELPVDSDWGDVYDSYLPPVSGVSRDDKDIDFLAQKSRADTLYDHLMWQLNLTRFSESDRAIATSLIDSISTDGYLTSSIEDILAGLGNDEIELDEVEAVLHRLQNFDPPGVAARDPRECLLIQLRQLPAAPLVDKAISVCAEHFSLLANQDYVQLKRRLKLSDNDLQEIIHLLRSLHPRPGVLVAEAESQYIIPDVFVSKRNDSWYVELNPEATPRLRVNPDYAKLIRRADQSEDNSCLKNHMQEARWFIKSLTSRNETVLRVASKIVELQRGFFEHGEEAMKPLVLRDVAEALEMHESTVSRVTTQKYMYTPRGTLEFKYFFSSHVSTSSGGECSATAIRALIKKLVAAEKQVKPLSDNKIAQILAEQGIKVARRTVAKYRESMGIPPSNERKRLL